MQVLIGGPWNLAIYGKKLQYHILLETDPFLLKSFRCSSSGFFRSFDCMMGQHGVYESETGGSCGVQRKKIWQEARHMLLEAKARLQKEMGL